MKFMNFSQMISIRSEHPEALVKLLAEWDEHQATLDVMGYIGTHLLSDRDDPGQYLIVAEFAVCDPEVPAADEAMRNNDRPETKEWAARLLEFIDGAPEYHNYDELYRTG